MTAKIIATIGNTIVCTNIFLVNIIDPVAVAIVFPINFLSDMLYSV